MDEETNGKEGSEEEDSPPAKRTRTGTVVLDDEEAEIVSKLRPILHVGTSQAVSQLEERQTRSQDGGDSGAEIERDDDVSGDEYGGGLEDNGVCHSFFSHDIDILISTILDIPL